MTHQQEEISTKIIKSILSARAANFISITGKAGTGKTLLIYDIAKLLDNNSKKSLIIHCGQLNEGQIRLNQCGWNIIEIKNYSTQNLSDYDVIIIDEAQRIYPNQMEKIVKSIKIHGNSCVFSYDQDQTLIAAEGRNNIEGLINKINSVAKFELSEKIRSNKEIANFTKRLFNNTRNDIKLSRSSNIEVIYFQNLKDAKLYLNSLDRDKWETLNFTPSRFDKEYHKEYFNYFNKTSHQVIGQEFEGVVLIIDKYFTYDTNNGELIYNSTTYYHSVKMLFQNITRTIKRLNIVIIDNEELLNRCMTILQ